MACYYYEVINESENPILKNVDISIILMMEYSERFLCDPFILNLSKKTIVQCNKGFKTCNKPSSVNFTGADLTHAYYTAFEYSNEHNYNNIIVLEEDAEVLYYEKYHYKLVDDFISKDFKIFSFASRGIFSKKDDNFFYIKGKADFAQALIISKNERQKLMAEIKKRNYTGHIDSDYMIDNVVVYKYPLIVQLFPETENFNNWGGDKNLHRFTIKLIGCDKNKDSWETIYLFSKIGGEIQSNVFPLLLIFLFIIFICRK